MVFACVGEGGGQVAKPPISIFRYFVVPSYIKHK